MAEIKTIPYSLMARKSNPSEKNSEKKVYATPQQRGTLTLEDLSAPFIHWLILRNIYY